MSALGRVPFLCFEHNGVKIWHTYKADCVTMRNFWFATSPRGALAEAFPLPEANCERFDVRALPRQVVDLVTVWARVMATIGAEDCARTPLDLIWSLQAAADGEIPRLPMPARYIAKMHPYWSAAAQTIGRAIDCGVDLASVGGSGGEP